MDGVSDALLDELRRAPALRLGVAIALVVGGLIILWAERRQHEERVQNVDQLTIRDAIKLGLFQALALIPGTSRSGATIIGGLLSGLSRRTAAEFSFFLAIPALLAATAYDIWKAREDFVAADVEPLIVSCVASFVSALLVTKLLALTEHACDLGKVLPSARSLREQALRLRHPVDVRHPARRSVAGPRGCRGCRTPRASPSAA